MPVLSVTSKFGWLPRARSYEEERAELARTATAVDEADLPLQEQVEKEANVEAAASSIHATLTESSAVVDPLSGDPLSAAAQLEGTASALASRAAAPCPPPRPFLYQGVHLWRMQVLTWPLQPSSRLSTPRRTPSFPQAEATPTTLLPKL